MLGMNYKRVWPSQEDAGAIAQALTLSFVVGDNDNGYGSGFMLAGGDKAKVCTLPNDLDLRHQATGTITFADNPTEDDTITINGVVFTYKASPVGDFEIDIKASLELTLDETIIVLNASTNALVALATYTNDATILTITYDTTGAVGETFTLAASSDTPSGTNLDGAITTISVKYEVYSGNTSAGEFIPSTTLIETITQEMLLDDYYTDEKKPILEYTPNQNDDVFVKVYIKLDIEEVSGSVDIRLAENVAA